MRDPTVELIDLSLLLISSNEQEEVVVVPIAIVNDSSLKVDGPAFDTRALFVLAKANFLRPSNSEMLALNQDLEGQQ